MDTKERHIRENEASHEEMRESMDRSVEANNRIRKNNSHHRTNRLWLWLGVIVLIFILFYWLFSIGLFEDLSGYING